MAWSRSIDPLRHWQTNLEISSETGQPSVLDLGAFGSPLDNAPMMVAFHAFANERCDLVSSLAVCSGHSLMWLIALMHFRKSSAVPLSPEMRVVYGGADLATHMASLSIYSAHWLPVDQDARGALPVAFAAFFDPAVQAGPALWGALPFIEMTARASPEPLESPLGLAATDESHSWLAWLAVLASVGLVLLAVMI
jgi:hypothetical protein